jgi:hypothetical protein
VLGSLSALQVRVLRALVDAGENLDAALGLVSRKDGGFSPPDLAWVLRNMRVSALAKADGYDAVGLLAFREQLVERLLG